LDFVAACDGGLDDATPTASRAEIGVVACRAHLAIDDRETLDG
jgi:hypothetical protein